MSEIISSNYKNNDLLHRIYLWMTIGLGLTAGISFYISNNPKIIESILKHSSLIFTLFFVQLGLVFVLSFLLNRISTPIALIIFLAYSILNGITMSGIFLIYTKSSIAIAFLVAAGMFLAMALYGLFTKKDLSGIGNFLFMGIIGLIIASLINLFFKSNALSYITSAIGVIIFSLLTAYDLQQLKKINNELNEQNASNLKISIVGALKLYLDFVNLFLYILRFLGKRKEN